MKSFNFEFQMKHPRTEMIHAVSNKDLDTCLNKTAGIHGHFCPGIALGVMATVHGLEQVRNSILHSDGLENLMAIVEINACFADGVQVVSGCTLGNNSLVYSDLGRLAATFAVRGNEHGVRVRVRPDFRARIERLVPEFYPLMKKVVIDREIDAQAKAAFKHKGTEAAFALIQLPFSEILISETTTPNLPEYAPITDSVVCSECGEMIMATKVLKDADERDLCYVCAGWSYNQVEGQGIVKNMDPVFTDLPLT